ncbi:hypothetical protein ABKN59_007552 [Abortiporus biennis]
MFSQQVYNNLRTFWDSSTSNGLNLEFDSPHITPLSLIGDSNEAVIKDYRVYSGTKAFAFHPQLILQKIRVLAGLLPLQQPKPDMTEHLIEANLHEFNTYVYSSFGCAMLVVYDTFITFDIEMEYIWRSKFNLASYIFIWMEFFRGEFTLIHVQLSKLISITTILTTYLFFVIRIWAMSSHRWFILLTHVPPILGYTVVFTYLLILTRGDLQVYDGIQRVSHSASLTPNKWSMAMALQITEAWSGIVVITSTLAKTFGLWRDSRKAGIRSPFTTLIIRDGAIYSLVTIFSSVVDMILDCKRGHKLNVLGTFGVTIATISVSRAILDLRSLPATSSASYDVANTIDNTTHVETLKFELSRTSVLYRSPDCLPTRSMND